MSSTEIEKLLRVACLVNDAIAASQRDSVKALLRSAHIDAHHCSAGEVFDIDGGSTNLHSTPPILWNDHRNRHLISFAAAADSRRDTAARLAI